MPEKPPPPIYIRDARALDRLVKQLARQPAIAVDSEANSLFAYQERLCLLQISTRSRDYLVDPLATSVDVASLAPVLADPGVMKVFHGAEYDILLLKRTHPFEIAGLFDTKVAATSLGFPSPGLAAVLHKWLGVRIDKKYQRSDWGKRPLTEGQKDYARRDTCYLLKLAGELRKDLLAAGPPHMEEVAAECRRLEALIPEAKPFDPDEFIRIKGAHQLDPLARQVLRELNLLRHEIAAERDQPPFKILGNAMLVDLARSRPRTLDELTRSRQLTPKLRSRFGDKILAAMQHALELGPLRSAQASERSVEDGLGSEARQVYEALRRWRKEIAERRGTDASLILPRSTMIALSKVRPVPKDLNQLSATGLLESWRVACYGEQLLPLLRRRRRRVSES